MTSSWTPSMGSPNDGYGFDQEAFDQETRERKLEYLQNQQDLEPYQEQINQEQGQSPQPEPAAAPDQTNPVQEGANAVRDATVSIAEDALNYGASEPEWVNIDEGAPELKTSWGKPLSEFLQLAVPLIAIGLTRGKAVKMLRNRGMLKAIPKGSWGDRLGSAAFDVGAEVAWLDATRAAENGNFSQVLKEDLGMDLPDFIATKDSDTPEAKRIKQQYEAVGFGVFGTLLASLFRLGKPITKGFLDKVRGNDAVSKEAVEKLKSKVDVPEDVKNPIARELIKDEGLREASDSEMALKRYADNGGKIPDPWKDAPDNYMQSGIFDEAERVPKAVSAEGVMEAVVDNAKIVATTPGGNGRMARFMSDAALDAISQGSLEKRTIVKGVEARLNDLAKMDLDFQVGNKWRNNKEVIKSMDVLVADMMQLPLEDLKKIVNYDTVGVGGKKINIVDPVTGAAFFKMSAKLLDDYSKGTLQASALAQTSMANDVMDSAVGLGLIGKEIPTERITERMLSMIEFLDYESTLAGSYAGWALNVRKQGLKNVSPDELIPAWKAEAAEKAAQTNKLAKEINQIQKTNPKYAEALNQSYELTNGSIKEVTGLTQAIKDATKGRRVIKNWGYASPGLMVEAISGLFYAFKLSSFYTPIKAIQNNIVNFVMKPTTEILGQLANGDITEARIIMAQYFNNAQSYGAISARLMSERFKQVQSLPMSELARADYKDRIIAQQDWMKAAQSYADQSGDLIFQMKVNAMRNMQAMADSKYFRYSTNLMESGDAANNVAVILTDWKGKLLRQSIQDNGGTLTKKAMQEIDEKVTKEGYDYVKTQLDGDFRPINPELKFASGEMAMNIDGGDRFSTMLGQGLNNVPILKTLILFPKTMLNSTSFLFKHSPLSVDHFRAQTLKDPQAIKKFLANKGIEYTEENWIRFKRQTQGRLILGTMVTGYASTAWATGNMTGNGSYDKTTGRMESEVAGKPKRSWRLGPGAPWMSYDGIEPISSIMALNVDVLENFNSLGTARTENLMGKIAYIFGDNITNKTFVKGLQPLFDFASGRPGAMNNYLANIGSISLLNQLGRTIDPAYREVETDLLSQLANKWTILGELGITEELPYDYSIVTGQKKEGLNFIGSSVIPVKLSKTQTKAEEILQIVEFPGTAMIKNALGQKLDAKQISEVKRLIGEDGQFAKEVVRIWNKPESRREVDRMKAMRAKGIPGKSGDNPVSWSNSTVVREINAALNRAVANAKLKLQAKDASIMQNANRQQLINQTQKLGDQEKLNELLGIN